MPQFEKDSEVGSPTQQQRAEQQQKITAALRKSGQRLGQNDSHQQVVDARQKIKIINAKEDQARQQ